MRFFVSDATHTARKATGVLHVHEYCATLRKGDRLVREASITELAESYTLCGMCAPMQTGREKP